MDWNSVCRFPVERTDLSITTLVETKGDHLDAEPKIRLRKLWENKAGNSYRNILLGFDAWHILTPELRDKNNSFEDLISIRATPNEGLNVLINVDYGIRNVVIANGWITIKI